MHDQHQYVTIYPFPSSIDYGSFQHVLTIYSLRIPDYVANPTEGSLFFCFNLTFEDGLMNLSCQGIATRSLKAKRTSGLSITDDESPGARRRTPEKTEMARLKQPFRISTSKMTQGTGGYIPFKLFVLLCFITCTSSSLAQETTRRELPKVTIPVNAYLDE